MTVRNAPARDVLMALAERGGYGFVFVNGTDRDGKPLDAALTQGAPVSISFHGEKFSRAFNSVLLSAGLQARLEGNLIVVGPNVLGQSFGTQLSKVYRLNQASASSAADYLASMGASITKVSVITNSTQTGTAQSNQVAGGTTTVADLVLSERGESLLDAFATWKTSVEESSCCDVVLSVAVPEVTDERKAEMEKLAKEGQRRQMLVCAKWHWSFFPPRGQAHPEHCL